MLVPKSNPESPSLPEVHRSIPVPEQAIKFGTIDSTMALSFTLFINAGILILAASAFHFSGHQEVGEIRAAYKLLSPVLGAPLASTLFGVALLA